MVGQVNNTGEAGSSPRLSICIATYRRGNFIGQTLDSILGQVEPGVEVLVVDGASPDNTPDVIKDYQSRHPGLRYFREQENSGVDRDYDKAVGYARGEYCWLMSDDDLLKPGAIRRVLAAIGEDSDLIVVNTEIWNADFSEKLLDRRLNMTADKDYREADREQLLAEIANQLGFIGCVVIRRSLWLSRDRASYYGSLFIHVGVIFQLPAIKAVRVIAEPLILIRDGNALWAPRTFEIWAMKWPDLIWSFSDFSEAARRAVCDREQWRKFKFLLFHRAMGAYSLTEFRKYLSARATGMVRVKAYAAAAIPGPVANLVVVLYYVLIKKSSRLALFEVLCSRHATLISRAIAGASGLKVPEPK